MQGRHRHQHRRALALVTCLLWLLGVEVLPSLHLALHRGDHTHGDDGSIVLAHREHHAHGDHDHADHDHDHDAAIDEDHDHDATIDEDHDHDHDAAIDEDHDHDHDHDAAIDEDHDHDADHDHGHGIAADSADSADSAASSDQPAIGRPRHAHHQAGGISHHAVALHRPPPPLLAPAFVARATWRLETLAEARPSSARIARPTSRGPPTV